MNNNKKINDNNGIGNGGNTVETQNFASTNITSQPNTSKNIKSKNNKNIPQLRFPEFNDEWEKKKLGKVSVITTGSTPSTSKREYYGGDFLFVSPADINKNRYIYNTKTKLTKDGFEKGRLIKKGSVLAVCIGSTIGKIGQASKDCVTNQQINSLTAIDFSIRIFPDFECNLQNNILIYNYL